MASSEDDLEVRVAAAAEFARAEATRRANETSTDFNEVLVSGAYAAAFSAIAATLEEILVPGSRSTRVDVSTPPFAGDLADAPPHPEEPQ